MSKKEILEGNKLIAEFMGFIWEEKYNGYYKPNPKWTIHSKEKAWIEKIDGKKRLKYHSSWDWLMPVVEKIEELLPDGFTQIYGESGAKIEGAPDWKLYSFEIELNVDNGKMFHTKSSNSRIEAVWLGVVEFIKWYNEKQQS